MYKFSNFIISKVFILVGLILIFLALLLYYFRFGDQFTNKGELFGQLQSSLLTQIKDRWEQGDLENYYYRNKFSCPDLIKNGENIDSEYLKCNPNYLECYLQGKAKVNPKISVKVDGKEFWLNFKRSKEFVNVTKDDSVKLNATISSFADKEFSIELQNTCRDVYLPQRIYSAGGIDQNYVWDNFFQHIFIDRFYVTNLDVYLWKKVFNIKDIDVSTDPSLWHLPSTDLTLKQRKRFCNSYGKQLLQSHVLDAASFVPSDINDHMPDHVYKFPYPWTKKINGIFLYEKKIGNDFNISQKDCTHAYVKDCLKFKFKHFNTDSVSWMGVNYTLGYYMEVVENPFNSFQNLKASSFYFNSNSIWHEIGKRAHWDGEGFNLANFNFKESIDSTQEFAPSEQILQVAFRCMKYREN